MPESNLKHQPTTTSTTATRVSREERRERAARVLKKGGNKALSSKRAALTDTTVVGNWTYVGDDGSVRQRRAAASSHHNHPLQLAQNQQKVALEQTDGTRAVTAPQKPSSLLLTNHHDDDDTTTPTAQYDEEKGGQLQILPATTTTNPPPSPPSSTSHNHHQHQSSRKDVHKNLVLDSVVSHQQQQEHKLPGDRSSTTTTGGRSDDNKEGAGVTNSIPSSLVGGGRRSEHRPSAVRVLQPVTATSFSAATEGAVQQQLPIPPSSASRHSRTGRPIISITDQHRYPVDTTTSLVVLQPSSYNNSARHVGGAAAAHTTTSSTQEPHPHHDERDASLSSGLHTQKSDTQIGAGGGPSYQYNNSSAAFIDDGSLSIRPLALQQQNSTTAPSSPATNHNALAPPQAVDSVRRPSLMLQSIYGDDYTEVQVKDSVSPLSGGGADGRSPNSNSTHSPAHHSKKDPANRSGSMPLSAAGGGGLVSSDSWSRDTQLGSNNTTSGGAMVVPTTTSPLATMTPRVVALSSGPLAFAAPFSGGHKSDNSWLGDTSGGGGSRPMMSLYEVATPCYPSTNPSSKYQKVQHPRLLKLLRYRQRQLLKARRRAEKEKAVEEARAEMFQNHGVGGESGESNFLDAFGGASGGDDSISGMFHSEMGPGSWMGGTNTTAPPGGKKGGGGGVSRKSSLRTHYISSDALQKNAGSTTPQGGRGGQPPSTHNILSSSCSDSSWASLYTTDSTDSDNNDDDRIVMRRSSITNNNTTSGDDELTAAMKGRHPFHKIVSKYKSKKPLKLTKNAGGNAALGKVIEDLSSKTGLLLESGRTVMDPSDLAALRDTTSRIRDASMKSKSLTQNANKNVRMTHPHRSDIVSALKTDFNMQNVLLTLESKMPLTSEEEQLAYERVYYFASKHEKFRLPVSGGDPSSTAAATATMEARFLVEDKKDSGNGEDDEQARRSAAATARSRQIHNRVSVKKVVHDPPVTEINLSPMDAIAAVRIDDNAEAFHQYNIEAMKNVVRRNRDRQRDMAAKKKTTDQHKEACELKKGAPLMLVTRSKRQKRQIQMDTSSRRLQRDQHRHSDGTPLSSNNKNTIRHNNDVHHEDDDDNWETASTNSSNSNHNASTNSKSNKSRKLMPDDSLLSPLLRKDTAQGAMGAYAAATAKNTTGMGPVNDSPTISGIIGSSLKLPAIMNKRNNKNNIISVSSPSTSTFMMKNSSSSSQIKKSSSNSGASHHVAKVPVNPKFTRYASISGGPAGGVAPVSMGLPNLSRGLDRVQEEIQRNRRISDAGGIGVLPVLASFHEANTHLTKALREASTNSTSNTGNASINNKGSFMSASRKADADQEMQREIDRVLIALKQRYAGLMTQPSTPTNNTTTTPGGVNVGESAASLRAAEELRQEAWLLDALTMRCFDAFTSHVPYDVSHPPPLSTYKGLLQQMQKTIPQLSTTTNNNNNPNHPSSSSSTTLPNIHGGGGGGTLQSGAGSGLFSRKSSLRAVGTTSGNTTINSGNNTPKANSNNTNNSTSGGNFTKTNSASSGGAWPVSESLTRKESAMGSSFMHRSESMTGAGSGGGVGGARGVVSPEGGPLLSRQPSQIMLGGRKASMLRKGGSLGWMTSQSAGAIANQASSLQILSLLSTAIREGWVDGNGSPIASKIVIDSDLISRANAQQVAQQKHMALQRPTSHVRQRQQPGGAGADRGVSTVGRAASIGRRLEELERATNMIQTMRGRPPPPATTTYGSSNRLLSPNHMELPLGSSGGTGSMHRINSGPVEDPHHHQTTTTATSSSSTTTTTASNAVGLASSLTLGGGGGATHTPTNQSTARQLGNDMSIMSNASNNTPILPVGAHVPAPPANAPREYGKFFLKGQQRAKEYEHLKQQFQKHQDALFSASGNTPSSSVVVPTGSMPKRRGSVSPGAAGGGVEGQQSSRASRGMSVRFADDAFVKMGLAESGGDAASAGGASGSSPSPLRPSAMSKKSIDDGSNTLSTGYYNSAASSPGKLQQPPPPLPPSKDDAIATEASKMLLQAMDGAPLMDRLQLRLRYGTIHPIHAIKLAPSDVPQELCGLVSECTVPSSSSSQNYLGNSNINGSSSLGGVSKHGSTGKVVSSTTTTSGGGGGGSDSNELLMMTHWVLRATGATAAASKADTTTNNGISEDKVSVSDDFFTGGGPNYWVLPPPRIASPTTTTTHHDGMDEQAALSSSSRFDDATSSRPTTKHNRPQNNHNNTVPVRVEYECRITTQQRSTAQSSSSANGGLIRGLSTGSKLHHSVSPGVPNRGGNGGGGGAGSFTSKKVETFHPLLQDSYMGSDKVKQGGGGGGGGNSAATPSPKRSARAPSVSVSTSSPMAVVGSGSSQPPSTSTVSQSPGATATTPSLTSPPPTTATAMHTSSSAATAIIPTSAPSTRKNDASNSLSTGGSGIVLSTGPSALLGPLTLANTLEKQRVAAASIVNIDPSLFVSPTSSPLTASGAVPIGAVTTSNRSSTTFAPEGLLPPPPLPADGKRSSFVGTRQQSVVSSAGGATSAPPPQPVVVPQPPTMTKSSSISFMPTPPTSASATTARKTASSKTTPRSTERGGKRPNANPPPPHTPFSPGGTLSGSGVASANPLSHFAASMLKQESRVRALVASTAADSCCNHYVQTVLCEKALPSLAVRIHTVFAVGGVVAPSKRFYDHWCAILSETTGSSEESRREMPVLSETSPSVVMNSSSVAFGAVSSSTFNNNTAQNSGSSGSTCLNRENTTTYNNNSSESFGLNTTTTNTIVVKSSSSSNAFAGGNASTSTRVGGGGGGGGTTRSGGTVVIHDNIDHPSTVSGAVEGALIDAATTAIVRSSSGSKLVGGGGGGASSSYKGGGLDGGGGYGSSGSLRRHSSSFVYAKAPGQDSNTVASGLIGYGMGPSPSRYANNNNNRLSISNNGTGATSVSAMMSYAASELHTDPTQIATFERIRSLEATKHVSIGGKVHLLDRNLDARKDYVAFLRESQRRAEEHHKLLAPNDNRLAPALLSVEDFEQYTNPALHRDRNGNRGTFNAAFEAFTDSKSVVGGGGDDIADNPQRRHPHPPAPAKTRNAKGMRGVTTTTTSKDKQQLSSPSSHKELLNPIDNDPMEQTLRAGGAAGAPSMDQRRRDKAVSDTIQSILEQEAQSLTMAGLLNKMSINRRNDRLEEEGAES